MTFGLRSRKHATALAALSLLILAGCAAPPAVPSASTISASTPRPTAPATALPAVTAIENAYIDNSAISIADIWVLSPGSGSQVTSPIEVEAVLQAGADGHVIAELSDQAGRLLMRQVLMLSTSELRMPLPFEVSRPPMPARLTLRTVDSYGRTQALNSVELMLLAEGEASIVPGSEQAHITISQPAEGQRVSSSEITVSGTAYTASHRPLNIQLITREGRVLAVCEVYPQGELSRPALFEAVFRIEVNEPTWAQVAVTEHGQSVPGPAHFSAVEILLEP